MRAVAYENFMGRWSQRLAVALVEACGVKAGDIVLDLACGTGALTHAVLDIHNICKVVGLDRSWSFVKFANNRFLDDPRVAIQLADASHLPYTGSSFNQTLSLLAFPFFTDPIQVALEMVRVTKAGGTVATCFWEENGFEPDAVFWEEARRLSNSSTSRKRPKMSQANNVGVQELSQIWSQIGLHEISIRHLSAELVYNSFEDFWNPLRNSSGRHGIYLSSLSARQRQLLKRNLCHRLKNDSGGLQMVSKAYALSGVTSGLVK